MKIKVLILGVLLIIANTPFNLASNFESPDKLFKKAKRLAKKDSRAAYDIFSQALQVGGDEWKKKGDCHLERGKMLLNSGYHKESRNDLFQAMQILDDNYEAYKLGAKAFFLSGDLGDSLQASNFAQGIKNDDAELSYIRGRTFLILFQTNKDYSRGNALSSAMSQFTDAIEKDKKYTEAYFYRGQAFLIAKKYDEAISDFQEAIKTKSTLYQAYIELAKTYRILNNSSLAIENLEKSIEIKEKNIGSYNMLIPFLFESGEKEKGYNYLGKALKLFPKNPNILRMQENWPEDSNKDSEKTSTGSAQMKSPQITTIEPSLSKPIEKKKEEKKPTQTRPKVKLLAPKESSPKTNPQVGKNKVESKKSLQDIFPEKNWY